MTKILITIMSMIFAINANAQSHLLPSVPEGAQAVSLFGKALSGREPSERLLENLAAAKAK